MTAADAFLEPNSSCPRCGDGFRCGMVRRTGSPQASTAPLAGDAVREATSSGADMLRADSACWCVKLPHIMPVPSSPPNPGAASATCFCPTCLQQITDGQQHPTSPACN